MLKIIHKRSPCHTVFSRWCTKWKILIVCYRCDSAGIKRCAHAKIVAHTGTPHRISLYLDLKEITPSCPPIVSIELVAYFLNITMDSNWDSANLDTAEISKQVSVIHIHAHKMNIMKVMKMEIHQQITGLYFSRSVIKNRRDWTWPMDTVQG